jgi:Kef-type K+ transport system membrane component KefB/Trk K+ transport system NAD-binding subunit
MNRGLKNGAIPLCSAAGMHELIHDIALCIIAAWGLGVLAQFIRQPAILAYLAGGFLIGPACLSLVQDKESVGTISELGLIFLLFMIGLEIDLKKIISAGRSILLTAASQIVGGCVLGVAFFRLIGFPLGGGKWDALYLGVAAALSSTVIIVKVLYDKRELDTLPGRVTLGLLVLQDLFVILFLAVQPSLDDLHASSLLLSFLRVGVLVATALVLARFALPPIFRRVARLPELVLVGAIAWCLLLGEFAAWLQLSREMGALIAGVSLSTFPYALDVTAKVTSLRDFFVTLFFVGLGMSIPMPGVSLVVWALVFSLFTVVSRLVTTFAPLYLLRQGLRASLLPSINLCQISEFSLVVLALGVAKGHVDPGAKGMVSIAFVLLATLSTLAMTQSDPLTRKLMPLLRRGGLRDLAEHSQPGEEGGGHGHGARILILGFFRTASSLIEELSRSNQSLLKDIAVVDFNPVVFKTLKARGIRVIYGDVSMRDTLVHAGVQAAEILVCTLPDSLLKGSSNIRMVRQLRELNPAAKIIVNAEELVKIPALYAAGADYVSVARLGEATELCGVLAAADCGLMKDKRAELDARLNDRNEVLP